MTADHSMIKVHTFKSGLRLVWQYSGPHVSHCGLMIGAGSRHETKGQEGLAHFIEHVLFKGTRKRSATQVLTRLESVGGELNAYTTREETCVHASFMPRHFERAADLIMDIALHSQFPEKEIVKEKEVVLDEILSYLDNPMEQIFDDFECQVFKGHPLGNPVLGTSESVRGFTRSDILSFVKKHYQPSSMVFSYAGPHTFEEVIGVLEKCFDAGKRAVKRADRNTGRLTKPAHHVMKLPVKQAHWICGGSAFGFRDPRRFAMYLMNNILGGPGMNSRLNMNIRERYGFTYNIESSYTPYRDTGLFAVYLATEQKHLERTVGLVNKEFKKLREVKIGTAQLAMHKTQMKGQIAIAQENRASVMLGNAKSVLNYGYPVTVEEVFRKIDEVSASSIQEAACSTLTPEATGTLIYMPS